MAQKSNNKMNISYTIRAIDRFTATHAKLERQLNQLERATLGLAKISPDIKVEINSGPAEAKVKKIDHALSRLPVVRHIWVYLHEVKDIDKLAQKLRNIDEILMQVAQGGIWMMLPTLGPIMAGAAGGAGALAAQLIGAGAAMGAIALVAVPTIKYINELDGTVKRGAKQWRNLSDATRDTLTALDTFRATWSAMQATFREPMLEVFALGLQGANTALKMFQPTIEGSIAAAKNLAEAFNANLGSDDVKGIFEWFGNTAGGYFEDLGKTIGNFLVGFMNMMVAFEPLTQQFADGFLNMSEKFREWSSTLENNKAFQDFLAYAAEQGPVLLSFIGNLVTFLVQLGIALAPVGEQVLNLVNKFLQWAEAGLKNNEWVGHAIALFMLWRAAMSVVLPIVGLLMRAVSMLWPVIMKVWTWIGKLQANFYKIVPYISMVWTWILKFGNVLLKVIPWIARIGSAVLRFATGPIGIAIQAIILIATIVYQNWDKIKTWTIETFTKIGDWIRQKWEQAQQVIAKVATWVVLVVSAFTAMYDAIVTWLGNMYDDITGTWDDVKSFLGGIDLFSIGGDIIQGLVDGISSIDVMGAVKKIGGKIKDGFTGFFSVHSPSRLMRDDVGRWITLGVVEGMLAMSSKAEREAEVVAKAIARPFENMNKDYQFTAGVSTARSDYDYARASQYAVSQPQQAPVATQGNGNTSDQYAVINIGGHEARGTIQYITREQDREKKRDNRFK